MDEQAKGEGMSTAGTVVGFCEACRLLCTGYKSRAKQDNGHLKCGGCGGMVATVSGQRKRAVFLRSLGFSSYREYLRSDLWAQIRLEVLAAAEHKCVRCGSVATQVHHRYYSLHALNGKDKTGLSAICRDCHWYIEFHPTGSKTKRSVANKKLDGTYDPSAKYRSNRWRGGKRKSRST